MRLKTWSRQWERRNLRKNSRAVFPGSLQKTSLKKTRKWEKNICCLFHYESSHSFYLSIKFILLANIKSFMLCHYSQAMVCPPPMTMFGPAPAPAILSSHNSPPVSWKTLRGALTVEKCSLEQLNWIYYTRAWVYYFQMEFYHFFVWRFLKSKYWFKMLKILKGLSVSEWCQARI